MKEIARQYEPAGIEKKWYSFWLDQEYFHATVNPDKKPYTIVIPPPNVTSVLHIGHAFNNTIQDMLIRYKRKAGFETLWMPGTDHAGIATQAVVERNLKQTQAKSRYDLGREKFVDRIWQWKEENGSKIIEQLKRMGCSCDWQRERFTMDEGLSRAVQEVFIRFYERGLIYRGPRIVNWDPASATALADDEVDHVETQGKLYHLRYKLADSDEYIVVATTRPETLLGDTAVAIAPDDQAKLHLRGRRVIIPFVNRPVPIISDEHVDKEFGSGFVKVTPAHDPNDFEIGQRHHLPQVIVLDKDGKVLPVCQLFDTGRLIDELPVPADLAGVDRFEARKKIMAALELAGQVEKIENHTHAVGHSYRSKVPVEPYLSVQWFVKMKPLAQAALEVVQDGRVAFYPKERFEKTYEHWMTTIRDWCISRQLWWGHRIPVWYNDAGEMKVTLTDPSTANEKWLQDPDVLDTWFSSQLWPFSTLGWPDQTAELDYFYPTDTLVTGPDIIFFWVARMIMSGMEFMDEVPFRQVYFNGIVRDEQGRKMSKSLGNGIDPLKMIEEYSADAMRFTLMMLSSEGQDLNLGERSFEIGRNFANKIWNAFRFLGLQIETPDSNFEPYREFLTIEDRWILSRYHRAIGEMTRNLDRFRLSEAVEAIYHFIWHDYCDWYLEMIKKRLYKAERPEEKQAALTVATCIMKGSMELLHPVMPFISEEIWQNLKSAGEESVVISAWPEADSAWIDESAEKEVAFIQEIIGSVRNLRAEMNVPPAKGLTLLIQGEAQQTEMVLNNARHFSALAKVEQLALAPETLDRNDCATFVRAGVECFVPLSDLIDRDKEKQRLQKEIEKFRGLVHSAEAKLSNEVFLAKAPPQVVDAEKGKLAALKENLLKLEQNYARFA